MKLVGHWTFVVHVASCMLVLVDTASNKWAVHYNISPKPFKYTKVCSHLSALMCHLSILCLTWTLFNTWCLGSVCLNLYFQHACIFGVCLCSLVSYYGSCQVHSTETQGMVEDCCESKKTLESWLNWGLEMRLNKNIEFIVQSTLSLVI